MDSALEQEKLKARKMLGCQIERAGFRRTPHHCTEGSDGVFAVLSGFLEPSTFPPNLLVDSRILNSEHSSIWEPSTRFGMLS